jgi:biopolymer transport protein ExbB/TolQ
VTIAGWASVGVLTLMVIGLTWLVLRLSSLVRRLEASQRGLEDDVRSLADRADSFAPLLADTRSALRKAQNERLRADDLIQTATSLTGTVDSATKFAVSMVSSPLVRALSFFSGFRRGVRRLARTDEPSQDTRVFERPTTRAVTRRELPGVSEDRPNSRRRRRR